MRLGSCDNVTYMAFGLVAEVGELADKIAKWKRKKEAYVTDDHLVSNTWQTDEVDEKHVELMKELGDVLWFVAGIADHFDYSLREVAEMNLEKPAERKTQGPLICFVDDCPFCVCNVCVKGGCYVSITRISKTHGRRGGSTKEPPRGGPNGSR